MQAHALQVCAGLDERHVDVLQGRAAQRDHADRLLPLKRILLEQDQPGLHRGHVVAVLRDLHRRRPGRSDFGHRACLHAHGRRTVVSHGDGLAQAHGGLAVGLEEGRAGHAQRDQRNAQVHEVAAVPPVVAVHEVDHGVRPGVAGGAPLGARAAVELEGDGEDHRGADDDGQREQARRRVEPQKRRHNHDDKEENT